MARGELEPLGDRRAALPAEAVTRQVAAVERIIDRNYPGEGPPWRSDIVRTMSASIVVTSLTINDGTEVPVPENGVVLFVGPNNAGKSQALRDISKLVSSRGENGVVIRSADVEYRGTADDLLRQFAEERAILRSSTSEDSVLLGSTGTQSAANAASWWTGGAPHIVAPYFVLLADTESRLTASRPAAAVNLYESNPYHALHRLYLEPGIEDRINTVSRLAFGQGVILDTWSGGSEWALRAGDLARPSTPRPGQPYLDRLRELPLLHEEGDGVRSMIGLLLNLLTGHQTISLIDEPEAFLHPPQARFLAKLLADDSENESRATFLSTHSSDVVHGTLEGSTPTTVVRLSRNGSINNAAVLDNDAVRRLWSDPLLRYSNLLEGLFTDAVVICESDADCKFFASIRDTIPQEGDEFRRPDILFTSCGGKSRMHVGLEALRAASVPVRVIGDFDVLNDWSTVSRLVTKAGGDASQFEADWRTLSSAMTAASRTPSVVGMREAVNAAFDRVEVVSVKALAPVREALKIENGWDRVKNTGIAGVPKGDPYGAASRLLNGLADLGIFLVPIGEMEDFAPSISGHGPGWLAGVLEGGVHESSECDPAREFLGAVLSSVAATAEATA